MIENLGKRILEQFQGLERNFTEREKQGRERERERERESEAKVGDEIVWA
ncbi:hypothetical protein ACOSB0_00130 [Candidatus Phytoplasma citri]